MSGARRGYAICTTPRSGSNYLCQILSSTGRLGHPLEYFNPQGRRALEAPDFPDAVDAQLDWILTKGASANGVYALKAFPFQLSAALRSADLFARLPNLAFVRLKRRDLLGQAISKVRAKQTGQYRASQAPKGEVRYDVNFIAQEMVRIACDEASWDIYFVRTSIAASTLYYEDVLVDPLAAANAVAALIGESGPFAIDMERVDLVQQRDEQTEEWRARFIREAGDRRHLQLLGV